MIFVTGCARSGTSFITRLLKIHGCYLGPENRVNVLYENVSVRENIVKSILMRIDADPLGQYPLPSLDDLPAWPGLRKQVLTFLGIGTKPAYKDAKLTLLWPLFRDAFPEAKWVLVRRDKQKIIESCMRTSFMRKCRDWGHWVDEHEQRFEKMRDQLDLVEVWTDSVISNPYAFSSVAKHCGLDLNVLGIERSVDHKKWHRSDVHANT